LPRERVGSLARGKSALAPVGSDKRRRPPTTRSKPPATSREPVRSPPSETRWPCPAAQGRRKGRARDVDSGRGRRGGGAGRCLPNHSRPRLGVGRNQSRRQHPRRPALGWRNHREPRRQLQRLPVRVADRPAVHDNLGDSPANCAAHPASAARPTCLRWTTRPRPTAPRPSIPTVRSADGAIRHPPTKLATRPAWETRARADGPDACSGFGPAAEPGWPCSLTVSNDQTAIGLSRPFAATVANLGLWKRPRDCVGSPGTRFGD